MILLSLDQSSHITGWAIFEDNKLVQNGKFDLKSDDIGQRLLHYRTHLIKLINEYKPNKVVFEDIQMQGQVNNVVTYRILAEILGVTEELVTELDMPYEIISSNTWKSKLDIKGKARTEQKRNASQWVLNTYNKKVTQDEADAICLGASTLIENKQEGRHYSFE